MNGSAQESDEVPNWREFERLALLRIAEAEIFDAGLIPAGGAP